MHDKMPKYDEKDILSNIILKLRNFRVYNNAEIRIPLNSTTLIVGPSGIGKTSILEAFVFILYDGVTKPEKFQTKNVSGWLFMNGIIFYRQKNPGLFKVWRKEKEFFGNDVREITKEYTQDNAQTLVNSIYGNNNVFISCSYLRQREFSPFLGSTDADKLQIIKEVAFKGSELDELKEPIKEATKKLQEQYSIVTGQLQMALKSLNDFDARNPSIAKVQIPENSEDVLKKVKELRSAMDQFDKDYEVALQREVNIRVFKDQADQAKAKQAIILNSLNQTNITAIRARLQEIEFKLKEFSSMSFDAEKIAKAHIFKQWTSEKNQLQLKNTAATQEVLVLESNIDKVFNDFSKNADKVAYADSLKVDIQHFQQLQNEIKTLLNQIGQTKLQDAKTALIVAEKELVTAKENEEKVRKDFEESKARSEAEAEAARVKAEKELQEAQEKMEREKERIEKEREQDKEKIKAENDKIRLANKMKCPNCQTMLIVGEDGKHLEKSIDTPSGIEAMLGSKISPIAQMTIQQNATPPSHPITQTPQIDTTKSPAVSKQSFNIQSSNPILSAIVPPQPTPIISTTPVRKITTEDLMKAINNLATASNKRDRIKVIVDACEEKLKNVSNNFDKPDEVIQILPQLTKYVEIRKNVEILTSQLLEHEKRKPEEITEKVIDTKEKDHLESEKATLNSINDNYNKMSKEIEMEETKNKQFTQMIIEIMNQNNQSSMDIRRNKQTIQNQIDQLMHLNSASELLAQRTILEKTMREKAVEAESIKNEYEAAQRCLTKTIEAERIYLQTAVDKINILLGQSLQKLFPDKPISVEISTTKELKSKKNQVSQRFNVKIFYNDAEYDSSKQLSGGEKDRVSLAITLAMSMTFGSPILFLDETLSSLDAELKSEAVSLLKQICKTKTCVVISHEETEGLYDNVLKLKTD